MKKYYDFIQIILMSLIKIILGNVFAVIESETIVMKENVTIETKRGIIVMSVNEVEREAATAKATIVVQMTVHRNENRKIVMLDEK